LNITVIVSAIIEWVAVRELFPHAEIQRFPYGERMDIQLADFHLQVLHSGWGKIASAGAMQYLIDHYSPDLVVNLGTCGGFEGAIRQGDVVLVDRAFVYDIVELMGDFGAVKSYYESELDLSWLSEPYPHPVRRGTIASADSDLQPEKIPYLMAQGAIAADWESAALAWVAQRNDRRLLILRAVSDLVGAHGGEAYDNIQLFKERTRGIMKNLFDQLPDWLANIRL